MKKVIVFILLVFILSMPVCAEDNYSKQYDNIGADHLQDGLDAETREILNENGINAKDFNWTDKLSDKGVIEHIWQFITDGAKTPVKAGVLIASIMFLALTLIALTLNLIIAPRVDQTFNLFYIGPHHPCELPILSTIYQSTPFIVFLLLYVLGYTAVALLVMALLWGGIILARKTNKKQETL